MKATDKENKLKVNRLSEEKSTIVLNLTYLNSALTFCIVLEICNENDHLQIKSRRFTNLEEIYVRDEANLKNESRKNDLNGKRASSARRF